MTNQETRHYARVHGTTRLVTPRSLRYDTIRAPRRRLVARLRDEGGDKRLPADIVYTTWHYLFTHHTHLVWLHMMLDGVQQRGRAIFSVSQAGDLA